MSFLMHLKGYIWEFGIILHFLYLDSAVHVFL